MLRNISSLEAQIITLQQELARKQQLLEEARATAAPALVITLTSSPVQLCRGSSSACNASLGILTFTAGVHLTSDDEALGGLSGLAFEPTTDSLVSVSDLGWWFLFSSRPAATAQAMKGSLHTPDGRPLAVQLGSNRSSADAEGITFSGSNMLVSFEREHRIWAYETLRGTASDLGLGMQLSHLCDGEAKGNAGVEALSMINETHCLAICERPSHGTSGATRALVFPVDGSSTPTQLRYQLNGDLVPVDLALLPPHTVPSTVASRKDAAASPSAGRLRSGLLILERDYRSAFGNR